MNSPIAPELMVELHEQWVNNPTTQLFLRTLEAHREQMVKKIAHESANFTVHDTSFRIYAYGVKTLDTITEIMTNLQTFNKLLQTPKPL